MKKKNGNGNGNGKTNGNGNGKGRHSLDNFPSAKSLPVAAVSAIDEKELERRRQSNIELVDTNVLIEDPRSVHELRRGGNLLVIPWTCMIELNNLKNQPGIMFAVREVIREIRNLQRAKDPSLVLEKEMLFANKRLDRQVPDDQILATMEFVMKQMTKKNSRYFGYSKIKMISNDNLEMRKKNNCRQIIVSRPVVPLDYEQQVGFLPGDLAQKLDPWLLPVRQNLEFIQDVNGHEAYSPQESPALPQKGKKAKEAEAEKTAEKPVTALEFLRFHGINVQLLDSIRGSTFTDSIIIIDEAQNLSRHQARTIATRVGKGTKIIFLCDLSQIDNHHLDRNTSGAAHLIHKLSGHHLVAVVNLKETLRSEFASLAEKVL